MIVLKIITAILLGAAFILDTVVLAAWIASRPKRWY